MERGIQTKCSSSLKNIAEKCGCQNGHLSSGFNADLAARDSRSGGAGLHSLTLWNLQKHLEYIIHFERYLSADRELLIVINGCKPKAEFVCKEMTKKE